MRCAAPTSAEPETAVCPPVAAGPTKIMSVTSVVHLNELPPPRFVTSICSVMAAGGVHAVPSGVAKIPMTRVLDTVVVIEGAVWLVLFPVAWPFSASSGLAVSTPLYPRMPPLARTGVPKFQV